MRAHLRAPLDEVGIPPPGLLEAVASAADRLADQAQHRADAYEEPDRKAEAAAKPLMAQPEVAADGHAP